jgi:hypothetical protein
LFNDAAIGRKNGQFCTGTRIVVAKSRFHSLTG